MSLEQGGNIGNNVYWNKNDLKPSDDEKTIYWIWEAHHFLRQTTAADSMEKYRRWEFFEVDAGRNR